MIDDPIIVLYVIVSLNTKKPMIAVITIPTKWRGINSDRSDFLKAINIENELIINKHVITIIQDTSIIATVFRQKYIAGSKEKIAEKKDK